uniref:TFIIIC_delta domain-containing protein n=1 Tax=Anopheles christyi TaxID=43041 RepID=A0A182JPM8_9DIPT
MEMQELTAFQQSEEIIQPFTINCVGDTVVVCAKEHTLVLRLKYKHIVEDGAICYELSRIKCSNARPSGALIAHEATLYHASDMEQRRRIMLDQTIFPNIAKVYICNVQSWISPSGVFEDNPREHLIANVTNMGQLTIYRLEEQCQTSWNTYVDISDTWQSHIYDRHPIDSYDELQIMVDEMTITCFAWETVIYQHPVRFAFGTKSGKIVFCNLKPNVPKIEHVHQEEEASRVIKYVSVQGQHHFLLVGLESGRLGVYRFGGAKHVGAFFVQYIATYFEEDICISAIECEVERKPNGKEQLLILAIKATYLLAIEINFDGTLRSSVTLSMENFMITGLQQMYPRNYIVSTLPGKIFHVHIEETRSRDSLQIAQQEVKTDLNVGSYALYGVAASRTRTSWFFLGYPSRRFDHLTLRSPTCIFFCRFNQRDALQTLLGNNSYRLDNYHDAAEVVRFHGNKQPETLLLFESVPLELSLDEQSIYALKLQLIQLSAKISYNTKRNRTTTEALHAQHQFICSLIEVINASRIVCWLTQKNVQGTELNPLQQETLRCLRNFMRTLAMEAKCPADSEYLLTNLKPTLLEVLENADQIQTPAIVDEMCSFCDAPIYPYSERCPDSHAVFRCVLSKIQIRLESDEITCEICQRYSIGPTILGTVLEQSTALVDYWKCCICDAPFRGNGLKSI